MKSEIIQPVPYTDKELAKFNKELTKLCDKYGGILKIECSPKLVLTRRPVEDK